MNKVPVYLKCNQSVQVTTQDVYLKDIGSLRCADDVISAKLKALKVHFFSEKGPMRWVVSSLKLIEMMEKTCPDIMVFLVGATDVLVEKKMKKKYGKAVEFLKIVLVCLVSFFGTTFTIMAYHNDIGINGVFENIYETLMGNKPKAFNILEVSYSVGLALGIIVFFNHIGRFRLTKDPTPIEVAMRNYEKDVDAALIENAERQQREEEV